MHDLCRAALAPSPPHAGTQLYHLFFGDRNYLQLLHNLPLLLLGYATPRRAVVAALGTPRDRPALAAALVVATLVVDPVLCGVFVHSARMREKHPLLTYGRAALRLATLAATLPRHTTRLTTAGRSQLIAYLFHDRRAHGNSRHRHPSLSPFLRPIHFALRSHRSVFSIASVALALIVPAETAAEGRWLMRSLSAGLNYLIGLLPPLLAAVTPRAQKAIVGATAPESQERMIGQCQWPRAWLGPGLAPPLTRRVCPVSHPRQVLRLLAYAGVCLAVQLLLSQPAWMARVCAPARRVCAPLARATGAVRRAPRQWLLRQRLLQGGVPLRKARALA